jgi:hypothetical protein
MRTKKRDLQKVSEDIREEYTEWVNITILLEEVVEILKVSKALWYTQQRAVLSNEPRGK